MFQNHVKIVINQANNIPVFKRESLQQRLKQRTMDAFDFESLVSMEIRKDIIKILWEDIVNGLIMHESCEPPCFVEDIAFATEEWSIERYRSMLNILQQERKIPMQTAQIIESLNWALCAKLAAEVGEYDDEADEKTWAAYAVSVKGCDSNPYANLTGIDDPFTAIRDEAFKYFQDLLEVKCKTVGEDELIQSLYYILQFENSCFLFAVMYSIAIQIISREKMVNDVVPKLLLMCTVYKDDKVAELSTFIIENCKEMITESTANAVLEYSGHLSTSTAGLQILENQKSMITVEGIIAALIPAVAKGNDHFLAVLSLGIIDEVENNPENIGCKIRARLSPNYTYAELIAPIIYILLAVTAGTGLAKHSVISQLINLYEDTLQPLLQEIITIEMHDDFVKHLFSLTCRLNHWSVLISLIDAEWMPEDILPNIKDSISIGHQKILHLLLEFLLKPDTSVVTTSGAIPKVFKNADILRLLPTIAKRFPLEAAWLLDELSYIPIPISVPRNLEDEPIIRSKLVKGIKLGHALLSEVTCIKDLSSSPFNIWSKVTKVGQLRSASKRKSEPDYENDSVICMGPETFVTQEAISDHTTSSYTRQTNALIRLLATGDEKIILKPITQAMMEFHWIYGYFWVRFAIQFLFVIGSIATSSALFWSLANQKPTDIDESNLRITSIMTIFFSFIFILQEVRQFIDEPSDYLTSATNVMDLSIHSCVIYISIAGGFFLVSVDKLLMGIILLLHATRLLLHLRIMPSVGPMVRITILASSSIFPLLVPMLLMFLAFTGGFWLVQRAMVANTRWSSFGISFQYVVTMLTWDYSVIDKENLFENFVLRILFHAYFLIFFVNIIIALMTVNVAEITSNQTAAWLVEVAQLMVELELYWPFPFEYSALAEPAHIKELEFLSKIGSLLVVEQDANPYSEINDHQDTTSVILYTAPREMVQDKIWWKDFPKDNGEGPTVPEIADTAPPPEPEQSPKIQISNSLAQMTMSFSMKATPQFETESSPVVPITKTFNLSGLAKLMDDEPKPQRPKLVLESLAEMSFSSPRENLMQMATPEMVEDISDSDFVSQSTNLYSSRASFIKSSSFNRASLEKSMSFNAQSASFYRKTLEKSTSFNTNSAGDSLVGSRGTEFINKLNSSIKNELRKQREQANRIEDKFIKNLESRAKNLEQQDMMAQISTDISNLTNLIGTMRKNSNPRDTKKIYPTND